MPCQLIQSRKIDDQNWGEKKMLDFLRYLPSSYFVYRELQMSSAYHERVRGFTKKHPDFVVVGPEIGVLAIEVKDWSLTDNTYEWRNQYTVLKRDSSGAVTEIDNPSVQADRYKYALMELVKKTGVFVTSIVAFPRISRHEFMNRLQNVELLQQTQSKFYLDLSVTLFREELEQNYDHPLDLLVTIAQAHSNHQPATESQIEQVNKILLPPSFRIGDYTDRQQRDQKLKVISEDQQRWIFGLENSQNYLLDVAGSGKTNALISRAIHLVDCAGPGATPRVLLTTYNPNLETNIRRIFEHKIASAPESERYRDAIQIHSVVAVMEQIVADGLCTDLSAYRKSGESTEQYEARLREDAKLVLADQPDRYRRFDYVFVDEIQDFDNFYLILIQHLCRKQNFFFVGDIGQKIYERTHNLSRIGLNTQRVDLHKTYQMYRTPRYIARLAIRFITEDRLAATEFEEHGYTVDSFLFPNKWVNNSAEILQARQPEDEIVERIQGLLNNRYTEADVMVITSAEQVDVMDTVLDKAGISHQRGESADGRSIALVDFMNVKGLEREVVFVSGIEDLYHRGKADNLFADEEGKRQKELFSRRKLYVSLTRCLEQLIIYYRDNTNPFVAELLSLNREIAKDRKGALHGV